MDEKSLINKYKIFDQTIQEINKKFITPDSSIIQQHRESFQDFFDSFRKILHNNDPILDSYHKIQYAGSNYDGLVVGTYKEFDMDILIKLPKACLKIAQPINGTVQIKLQVPPTMLPDRVKVLEKWIDSNDTKKFILPDNFRKWGESVVHKSLNGLDHNSGKKLLKGNKGSYLLKMKKSGPAFTMAVEKQNSDIKFDVDLVFCLEFEEWPQQFLNVNKKVNIKEWLAVPKTPNHLVNQGFKNWRYSFPDAEKSLLTGNKHLKSTIKLIKKFRDAQNLNYLPSYFIKTLFLWEIEKQEAQYWTKSIGFLFITMLMKLKNVVESKTLPFYWDKKLNLLDSLSENQISDCKITLTRMLNKIETFCVSNSPDSLKQILLTNDEHKMATRLLFSTNESQINDVIVEYSMLRIRNRISNQDYEDQQFDSIDEYLLYQLISIQICEEI